MELYRWHKGSGLTCGIRTVGSVLLPRPDSISPFSSVWFLNYVSSVSFQRYNETSRACSITGTTAGCVIPVVVGSGVATVAVLVGGSLRQRHAGLAQRFRAELAAPLLAPLILHVHDLCDFLFYLGLARLSDCFPQNVDITIDRSLRG